MKRILIFNLFFFNFFIAAHAQNVNRDFIKSIPISPYLIGQNAWGRSDIFEVQEQIKQVKYQTIRIGGNGYENDGFILKNAIKYIDYARSVGAEPILQMPRQLKDDDKAYKAIAYINGEMGKKIKFWSIGNEPDHKNQLNSPEEVYNFFTKISEQIKRYDPEAKVMGFDLASYTPKYMTRLLGGDLDLTGKIPGQDYYYLDAVTFHGYRFIDISGFEADVKFLKEKLATFNVSRPVNQQLGWAITEFNSHWLVDPKLEERYLPYTFHNGQVFAEMYDLGMREGAFTIAPWSILEGGADREGTDLSLFDLVDSKHFARSNYYHTLLLAQNFRNNYLAHHDNKEDVTVIPMGDENGVSVMILNKNRNTAYNYILNLIGKIKKSDNLSIALQAGLAQKYKSQIPAFSTQMLVFSKQGKLIKKYTYSSKDADAMAAPREEKR